MVSYIILYTDARGLEKRRRFDGSHKDLLALVNKLQSGQRAGDPPVIWSQVRYRR